jgi:hypothetical protein
MNKIVMGTIVGIVIVALIVVLWNMQTEEYSVLDQNGVELGKVTAPMNYADGCEVAKDAAKIAEILDFECDWIQTGSVWEVIHITGSENNIVVIDMQQKTAQIFYST